MTDVNDWIVEYEDLIIHESHDKLTFTHEDEERLNSMRFQLTAKLWGSNLK